VAAIGALSDSGIQASSAGTGLRRVLATLAKDAKKLGIETFDASGKLKPLADIIGLIEERGLSGTEALEIFGLQGGPIIETLLARGSSALREYSEALEDAGGTADRLAKAQTAGLAGALKTLNSAFEELQLRIAESGLAGAFEKLINKLTSVIIAFSKLDETTLSVIVGIGAFVAAIGPLLVVIGLILTNLPVLISGFAVLTAGFAALTGPISLTVLGITALTTAIIAVSNGWKPFEILIKKTEKPLNDFSKATQIAKDAQVELNKAVGVSIKDNPDLINSVKDQTLAKIESAKVTLSQINTQRLLNLSIQEEITLKEKLLFILNGGLTPEQRANERQTERNVKINKDFAAQSEILWKELNVLSLSIFKLGIVAADAGVKIENLKQTFEEFSALADIRGAAIDLEIFSVKIAEEDAAFRNKLGEEVENKLSSLRELIAKEFSTEVIEVDVGLNAEKFTEIGDEFVSLKDRLKANIDELSLAFNGLGSLIGRAFDNPALGQFLASFTAFAVKLIATNFKISSSNAVTGATNAAVATGPAAPFTLPAFLATSLGLVASAFAAFGGGGSRPSVGGGGGGMGAGSSFTGSGGMAFAGSRDINLMGSFRIDGNDLLYVIDRTKEGRK
jgi:membrane protein implicated in regulation of membrane protease activity